MEKTSPIASLTEFFTPPSPSEIIEGTLSLAAPANDTQAKDQATKWSETRKFIEQIVNGDNDQLLADVIGYTRELIRQGEVSQENANLALTKQLSSPGAFSIPKVQWFQAQGFDLAPTPSSAIIIHKNWASASDTKAFDWALSRLSLYEESPARTQALLIWLDNIVQRFDTHSLISNRFNEIEKVRPGIVREWVSSLPGYASLNKKEGLTDGERRLDTSHAHLQQFFITLLHSQDIDAIADWVDPSRYGTPKSVSILFESATSISYRRSFPMVSEASMAWAGLARAIDLRPEAKRYWHRQTNLSRSHPTLLSNRPRTTSFPCQSKVFGDHVIGSHPANWKLRAVSWDARLPMEPLGRMLGASDPLVKVMATTPRGREKIVQVMKFDPAFMAYGFACFGQEILSWDQARQLDGFRDRHGYGAARYLLSTCSPVTSSFDISLHRCLRQYKGICDDAHPRLENLFIDERAQTKYKAMELRKVARQAKKKSATRSALPKKPMM